MAQSGREIDFIMTCLSKSCWQAEGTSATLKVLNDFLYPPVTDRKQYCAAVFFDLAKAFDSVKHHILIGRLDILGLSNDCLAWFTNYFSDRVQCVKSEGLLSGPLEVSMGVPQG
jgi:hypothetical protein